MEHDSWWRHRHSQKPTDDTRVAREEKRWLAKPWTSQAPTCECSFELRFGEAGPGATVLSLPKDALCLGRQAGGIGFCSIFALQV